MDKKQVLFVRLALVGTCGMATANTASSFSVCLLRSPLVRPFVLVLDVLLIVVRMRCPLPRFLFFLLT